MTLLHVLLLGLNDLRLRVTPVHGHIPMRTHNFINIKPEIQCKLAESILQSWSTTKLNLLSTILEQMLVRIRVYICKYIDHKLLAASASRGFERNVCIFVALRPPDHDYQVK